MERVKNLDRVNTRLSSKVLTINVENNPKLKKKTDFKNWTILKWVQREVAACT